MWSPYREPVARLTSLISTPEVIIIPGSGLHTSSKSVDGVKPSWDARLRISAGVMLFKSISQEGVIPRIIVCGGEVYPGYDTLASVARRRVSSKTGSSEADILRVDNSYDTVGDVGGARSLMDRLGLRNGVVISNDYHQSALALALKYGLSFQSAESVLSKNPRYKVIIDSLKNSEDVKKNKQGQLIRTLIVLTPGGEAVYQYMARRSLVSRAVISVFDTRGLQKMVKSDPDNSLSDPIPATKLLL